MEEEEDIFAFTPIPSDMPIERLRFIVAKRRDNYRKAVKYRHEMSDRLFERFQKMAEQAEQALRSREAMLEAKDAPQQ
jgi:hypothetical protein